LIDLEEYLLNLQKILIEKIEIYELINPLEVLVAQKQKLFLESLTSPDTPTAYMVRQFEEKFFEIVTFSKSEVEGDIIATAKALQRSHAISKMKDFREETVLVDNIDQSISENETVR
jgi:hypothetical protein